MKNIVVAIVLSILVLSPNLSFAQTSSSKMSSDQTSLLIQLLLEKIKVLQLELQTLIKAKESPSKVEITNQNADYKKAVAPLLDSLEEKESARKILIKKLEESQCLNPHRMVSKGVITFTCKDKQPTAREQMINGEIEAKPVSVKSKELAKEIAEIDVEIEELNEKIASLKTRHGISS